MAKQERRTDGESARAAGERGSERQPKAGSEGGRLASEAAAVEPAAAQSSATPAGPQSGAPAIVGRAKLQYIIAPRHSGAGLGGTLGIAGPAGPGPNLQPMSASTFRATIGQLGLDIVKTIRQPSRSVFGLMGGAGTSGATDTYVARVEPDRAALLAATAPQLIVERDRRLEYGNRAELFGSGRRTGGRLVMAGLVQSTQIAIRVLGHGDQPLKGAVVQLTGDSVPTEAVTDANGNAVLNLVTMPGGGARTLYVITPGDHWDTYITNPELLPNVVNTVRAQSLRETITGFPGQFRAGWGQRDMGVDQLPRGIDGSGVRIAIIDSGCDNTHPLLQHVQNGFDFADGAPPGGGWNQDTVGHGTHCAGVITARPDGNLAMRGIAPGAEVTVIRVFPGGRFSSLIEAIDRCIDLGVDVVNLSLGGPQSNSAVEQRLVNAVTNGVAFIVAAGNSGDEVKYPASSPEVLCVSAMGKLNQYPDDTWDASTVEPTLVSDGGIFSPKFTCFGPEVAVSAPGVAIISSVPGGGFEAESGTSMAAPHVTGLAALLLAHHPVFQGPLRQRNVQRVANLYKALRSMCVPLAFVPGRAGAGLPRLNQTVLQMLVPSASAA